MSMITASELENQLETHRLITNYIITGYCPAGISREVLDSLVLVIDLSQQTKGTIQ